jgi:hypothetical protein
VSNKPPTPGPQVHSSYATVSRSFKHGKVVEPDDIEQEPLYVHQFLTQPGEVEVAAGATIKMGEFEYARLDVRVRVPVYREELNEAFDFARSWVHDRLNKEVAKIKGAAGKKDSNPF